MALISLVYVSFAPHQMSADELRSILEVSRDNNAPRNITGMLLYRNGFFIQALEGEEEVVMPLYDKIQRDPRHDRVMTVYKGKITERTFKDWSMGFYNLDDVDFSKMPGYHDLSEKNFTTEYFSENPSRARDLLMTFKDQSA